MNRHLALPFILVALLLAGCSKRETAAEDGIRTNTLLIGNSAEPASFDPHLARSVVDQNILMALFEGLTALDEQTAQPVPAAAERWDVSSDGLVYTFHLRPGARWSNGDPVVAADFAFAFHRILEPKFGAFYSYLLWPIRNAEAFNKGRLSDFAAVGIEVVDAGTLRLTLERPTPYLPALAAHYTWLPLHRATLERYHAVSDRTAAWAVPGKLVGNGPFTLEEWRANVRVMVKKNPRYWGVGQNRLEYIQFFPTESSEVEERNFRTGQVHVTSGLPPSKVPAYRERNPSLLRVDPFYGNWFLRFNVTKPPFNDPRIRRALAVALDRQALVDRAFAGTRRSASSLTPPGLAGYSARAAVQIDYAEARRLLAAAGFPDGRGLPVFELLVLNSTEFRVIAEIIQEQWRRELGVRVAIAVKELRTFSQSVEALEYELSIYGWVADYADPMTFLDLFLASGGNNWTGWKNAEYDRLIVEASRTLDPALRLEFFQQAEAMLLKEAPIAPLFFEAQTYLIHPAVRGWVPSQLLIRRYQRVWLEK